MLVLVLFFNTNLLLKMHFSDHVLWDKIPQITCSFLILTFYLEVILRYSLLLKIEGIKNFSSKCSNHRRFQIPSLESNQLQLLLRFQLDALFFITTSQCKWAVCWVSNCTSLVTKAISVHGSMWKFRMKNRLNDKQHEFMTCLLSHAKLLCFKFSN